MPHNPLYRAFRAKGFPDRGIMLHFHVMDILFTTESQQLPAIVDEPSERLNAFEEGDYPDEFTVRRKLSECEKFGLVAREKHGREIWYPLEKSRIKL